MGGGLQGGNKSKSEVTQSDLAWHSNGSSSTQRKLSISGETQATTTANITPQIPQSYLVLRDGL